jgi:hypothetical protein
MNSFLFGLALIGVVIILQWYLQNDSQDQNDGSIGLLALKSDKPKESAATPLSKKRTFRRKA